MSTIADLVFRYLHRQLGASGSTPTQYTASAGTARTAVCTALTEADDYWVGAIVRWDSGNNAGQYSSVAAFDADTDTLTLDVDLPYAVESGDTFTLFAGGLYASDQRIPGMTATAPVNVTGFTIAHAGMINGEGTGVLAFQYNGGTGQGLTWTPPGETEGLEVDVSGLTTGESAVLVGGGSSSTQRSKYLVVTRTADAMPTADAQDNILLQSPTGSFLPIVTGEESEAGVTIYRPVAIENAGADPVYSIRAYLQSPWEDAEETTVATGGSIGTGTDELTAENLGGWGAHGFVYNATKDDLRYYYDRSGNTVSIAAPSGGIRGFTAAAWEADDILEPFPWFDIGLDAPGGSDEFEDPADESTAPSGVTFSCPRTAGEGLIIGDLAAGGLHVVWERFFIPATFSPVEAGRADLYLSADVTE